MKTQNWQTDKKLQEDLTGQKKSKTNKNNQLLEQKSNNEIA